jgi:hypothetical protein
MTAIEFAEADEDSRRESENQRDESITPRTGQRMDRMILIGLASIILLADRCCCPRYLALVKVYSSSLTHFLPSRSSLRR